jgi:hypothetical protein
MGDLSDFERGQIIGTHISGASVTKTITLLGVSRSTVSKVVSAYTNHGKTTSAKGNSRWKSTLIERYHRTLKKVVSKDHTTTAAHVTGQQNWIFILNTLFPQKLSDASFTNPTSTVGLQLLNLWLLKVMSRCINDGVTTIKPGHQTACNVRVWYGPMSRPSRSSIHQEEFTFAEHPKKPAIWNTWFQQWNIGEVLWWFGQQYRFIVFCWSHYYLSCPNYCKGVCGQVGKSGASQNFQTTMQFSKMTMSPFTQLDLFGHGLKSIKVNFNSSLISTVTRFEYHWTILVSYGD